MRKSGHPPTARPIERLALGALLFLGVLPAVAQGGTASLAAVLNELGYEQIELRRTEENHLFLFGRVNGRRRSCLVDTGWSLTTISTNAAQRFARPGIVDELRLGRVTLTNLPAVVQDLRRNGQPAAFDVVLGCDFLIRYHAVIDCADRRLYLRREPLAGEAINRLTAVLRQRGRRPVDMTRHKTPALTCEARLNDRNVELLVDTGAMWSCLDTETARALELSTAPSASQITGVATTGRRGAGVTRVKRFAMSDGEAADVNFAVLELADWGLGTNGAVLNHVGGILGGDQLLTGAAVIDCGQLKLWRRVRN